MKKSIFLSCVFAVALVGTLFSLPKSVVNTKGKEVESERSQSAATTNTPPAEAASENHNEATLSPDQQNEIDQLKSGFMQATGAEKQAAGILVSDKFAAFQKLDSAALYAEKVAQISPSIENLVRTGDRYYEAYGFAVDEQKLSRLGEKTREYYQKALDQNPGLMAAKANMAMTYVSTPTPMQGIMMLREVLDTDPTNELALFNLGLLSMRSNQHSKAADRFRQILANNPDNTKAKFYLGITLVELGEKEQAAKVLAEVKKTEKDPMIQQAIGELEARLND